MKKHNKRRLLIAIPMCRLSTSSSYVKKYKKKLVYKLVLLMFIIMSNVYVLVIKITI